MCNRRAPVRLARHRPILVILAGNIPEKVHFRENNLLRHQVGSHPASIGDRSATHRFRESPVLTGDPLEHFAVQRRNQEPLTQTGIERLSGSALLQNAPLHRRCGQAGHADLAPRIVPDGIIATH